MADWRDSLLPGSIGGVPLFISEVKSSVGRRTTSRELPFRDTPSREDLGRRARRFSVSGFVIGSGYLAERDAVIDVFETRGPWLFTHPWWGELSVILDEGASLDIAESDGVERLGKDYGLRVVSFPDGDIQYTRAGIETLADVVIHSGINVVSGGVSRSANERFSDYVFKGQKTADDDNLGEVNTSHQVTDSGVTRYRPLLIETDEQVRNSKGQFTKEKNKSPLQLRAEWERNTRAGRSRQLTYDVCDPDDLSLSWEMPGRPGELWRSNTIVTVIDPFLDIDGQYLVTAVTLVRDESGTRTSLTLTFPEAYETELPPKKKGKKGFTW